MTRQQILTRAMRELGRRKSASKTAACRANAKRPRPNRRLAPMPA